MKPLEEIEQTDLFPFSPDQLQTPAFVYDEERLVETAERFSKTARALDCRALFSMKALTIPDVLVYFARMLDGFSTSSVFEAILARQLLGESGEVHFMSPCIRDQDIGEITALSDYVTFNSVSQWKRFQASAVSQLECGIRVNPHLSFVEDERYDPCRRASKLGVGLDDFPDGMTRPMGIHFHNNCESVHIQELLLTIGHICKRRPDLIRDASWFNIGGGYLFDEAVDKDLLGEAIGLLRRDGDRPVFLEPGAGLVQGAGYIAASVVDCFESDGEQIAVLDTTVNHMPEVFEYQYRPDVLGQVDSGHHRYTLVGATCLAGDVFGDYSMQNPLHVGSLVVFPNAGAYTLVKAHMFNGINLPTVFARTRDNKLIEKRSFGYSDFLNRCGGSGNAIG